MGTRAMGPLAGIGWLKNGIKLVRDNPKAVVGGATLALVVLIVLVAPVMLLQVLVQTQAGMTGIFATALSFLPMLVVLVLSATLMVGFLRLLDAAAHRRPVGATGVFSGFRDFGGSLRAIALMLLVMVLNYALLLALLLVFAPGFVTAYMELLQLGAASGSSGQAGAQVLENVWIVFALMAPLSLFFYAVQALGLGQVALRGRGVLAALADGFAGAARNAVPLLLFAVLAVIAGLVAGLLIALVAMLLGFVAGLVGTWLQVTLLVLAVPAYIGLMVAVYALMLAVMYCLWRDICDGHDEDEVAAEALTA